MPLIYSTAIRVLTWIGPLSDDPLDKVLLDMISRSEKSGNLPLFMASYVKKDWLPSLHPSFVNLLLTRPYWTRLWVIQEVSLTKEVQIIIGPYAIDYSHLVRFVECLEAATDQKPRLEKLRSAASRFLTIRPGRPLELTPDGGFKAVVIIALISIKQCQDRRDKIFGIHSLLPPDLQRGIPIDYSARVCDVFASAMRAIVERDGNLNVITIKDDDGDLDDEIKDLPSWAVNWAGTSSSWPFSFFDGHQASLPGDISQRFAFSGKVLDVVGFQIVIVERVRVREWYRDPSEDTLGLTSLVEHSRKFLDDVRKSGPIDKAAYTHTCLGGLDIEQSGIQVSSFVANGLFGSMDEIPDAVDLSLGLHFEALRYRALFSFDPAKLGRRQDGGDSSKCFGLGNARARLGDIIAILCGVDAPVILRPAGEHFKVVGDAYVHMYMKGETFILALEEGEHLGRDLVEENCETFSLC